MPKKVLDVMSCEVMRGVRMTAKTVEYVSFKVPRRAGTFQADLFPPCRTGQPSMTFDEYWSGENKEIIRMDMKPGEHHETFSPARKQTFLAKMNRDPSAVASV
jgi:hypothetical protein